MLPGNYNLSKNIKNELVIDKNALWPIYYFAQKPVLSLSNLHALGS